MNLFVAAQLIHRYIAAAPSVNEILKTLQQDNVFYVTNDCGIAVVLCAGSDADLLWIVAHPPQQGHGTHLMQHLLTALRAKGVNTLWLEVAVSNIAAQTLYQKFGGIVLGRRKAYYTHVVPAEDALVMRCTL